MAKHRVVLVGCGYIAPYHLRAWSAIREAEVVGLCDLGLDKAKSLAAEFEIEHTSTDYEALVRELTPNVLDIATGPSTHSEMVRFAAEHNVHVLCQKPLAETLDEVDAMVEICRRHNIRLMVNENLRWADAYRELKALLDDGTLGKPFYLQMTRHRLFLDQPLFPNQPFIADMPRAILFEMGIHYVDVARFLLGGVTDVFARMQKLNPLMSGEDFILMQMSHQNGAVSMIQTDWCSLPEGDEPRVLLRLSGTKGTAVMTAAGELKLLTNDGRTRRIAICEDDYPRDCCFERAHAHFIACLESDEPFETGLDDNRETLKIVFAGYDSAERGRVINL